MQRRNRLSILVLAALVTLAVVAPRIASAAMEITPFMGVLHPLENQIDDGAGPFVGQFSSGPAYGARAGWWLNPRFGFDASVTVAATEFGLVGVGGGLVTPGTWYSTDARLRLRLLGADAPMAVDLLGGAGYTTIRYGLKGAFQSIGLDTESTVSWVFGAAGTVPVGSSLGLCIEIADHMHDQNFEADPLTVGIEVDDRTQHDLVVSLGLVVPFGSR
jgi:hypothetical protein